MTQHTVARGVLSRAQNVSENWCVSPPDGDGALADGALAEGFFLLGGAEAGACAAEDVRLPPRGVS